MKQFRHILFPLLICLFIVAVLIYRLSSCTASVDSGVGTTAAASSPAPSASPPAPKPSAAPASPSVSPSPVVNYTNNDITKLFKKEGYDVRDIRDAGSATAVEFFYPDMGGDIPSSFAWFDRESGVHDVIGGGFLVDKYEITPQKSLTVLTTGKDYVNGMQWFPVIYQSDFNDGAEAVRYLNNTYPYFMPIDKSFTVSGDRPESLSSITFDYDAVSAGFAPQPGHEGEFETAFRFIPKTSVVTSNGNCYITFYNTTLATSFKAPKAGTGDSLRSFVSVKCDGTNTLLTLKLGEKADRYNVSMAYSPDDGMPYAVLKFRSNENLFPVYPAGW